MSGATRSRLPAAAAGAFLFAAAIVVSGCMAHRAYRIAPPAALAGSVEGLVAHLRQHALVIEFDDQGDPFDPPSWAGNAAGRPESQFERARSAIRRVRAAGHPVTLIEFVHGWKHNAAPDTHDNNRSNLHSFERYIAELNTLASRAGPMPRVYVGVYFGWRGAAWSPLREFPSGDAAHLVNWLPLNLTLWNRMEAADRVASAAITHAMLGLAAEAKMPLETPGAAHDTDSRVIMVGHSLGGRIVERAVAQALVGGLVLRSPDRERIRQAESDLNARAADAEKALPSATGIDPAQREQAVLTDAQAERDRRRDALRDAFAVLDAAVSGLETTAASAQEEDASDGADARRAALDGLLVWRRGLPAGTTVPVVVPMEIRSAWESATAGLPAERSSAWRAVSAGLDAVEAGSAALRTASAAYATAVADTVRHRTHREVAARVAAALRQQAANLRSRLESRPADLVLLLNPAVGSLLSRQMAEALADPAYMPAGVGEKPRPWIVSVSSESDWATDVVYGKASWLASPLRHYRNDGEAHQLQFHTKPASHNDRFRSHETTRIDVSAAVAKELALLPTEEIVGLNLDPVKLAGWLNARGLGHVASPVISPSGLYSLGAVKHGRHHALGYWAVRVDGKIIGGHNDIFNPRVLGLSSAIMRITTAGSRERYARDNLVEIPSTR